MTIEERLTKLERKNRMLTLALVSISLAATLVVTIGMGPAEAVPEEVKAHRFILVDAYGKVRAGLVMAKDGPRLDLLDENSLGRVGLAVFKDGPRLGFYDENGRARAGLAVVKDGSILELMDKNGKRRVVTGLVKDVLRLELYDGNGRVLRTLP